jgi:peptide/nickel transport system substrate-binding protein
LGAIRFSVLALLLLLAACSTSGPARSSERGGQGLAVAVGQKVLVAGMQTDPKAFNQKVARATASGPIRGGLELEWLLNAGLTNVDDRGAMLGQLADAAPSIDNGRWVLFPDGQMETTWRIRAGATWHDATAFTADDLLFTAQVVRDPEVSAFRDDVYELIEAVESPDPRTIVVRWKAPTVEADRMFSQRLAVPMPRHILEPIYREDKSKLLYATYWLGDFVGTGPFVLRNWTQGSGVILEASGDYVLGRPRIDTVEVKFITDPNTMVSNLLAGSVDLTLGYGLSLEPALHLRNRWANGRIEMAPNGWIPIHPQFINPNPPLVADLRFRQALIRALDRQEMTETLQAGLVKVAHAFLDPSDPDYPVIERQLVRYDYAPGRTTQGLRDMGYTRLEEGAWVDASGQRLEVEIQTVEGLDIQVKATAAVAASWQRLGVGVHQFVRSATGNPAERETNASFPGFRLIRQPNTIDDMKQYLISQTPIAEHRFVGQNFTRYMNPEYNDLILRYFRTIPRDERTEVLGQILHHQSENLIIMGLFYNVQSVALGKRVQNVTNSGVHGFNQAWNAHQWDLL